MNEDLIIKEKLVAHIFTVTNKRLEEIDIALSQARESSIDDTKSSAGDKYETSREMIQQDITRLQKQRLEVLKELEILRKIELVSITMGRLGALVTTDRLVYFLATSLGQVSVEGKSYAVISAHSPIGKCLNGIQIGQSFEFNGAKQVVKNIV